MFLLAPGSFAAADSTAPDDDAFFEKWLRGDDLDDLQDVLVPEEDRAHQEVVAMPRPWMVETKVRGGTGYRDNVMRSSVAPSGGAFLLGGFETMVMRVGEPVRFFVVVEGDHLEFAFDRDLPSDTFASAVAQLSVALPDGLVASLAVRAFYLDQVIDVSLIDQPGLPAMRTRGQGAMIGPSLRKTGPGSFFVEASASAGKQTFRAPLWDYRDFGPKIIAGWAAGPSEAAASLEYLWRDYDGRPALTREGTPIVGSDLEFRLLRPEVSYRRTWSEGRWQSQTRLGLEFNRDNATGYFDYDRLRAAQRLGYRTGPWQIEARAGYSRYRHHVQRAGVDGPLLRRDWTEFALEGKRSLSDELEAFLRYEREKIGSNDENQRYTVDTWVLGLGWQF